ncbi:thermonuclease family protein [Calothrix sp. UHCC 0171]|uniref:thermonuclease family protein n=1 Tax=Calothrix sp. UHCC 0171 TaxID=3110245 RepID=UPI002B212771|nr:thermonuclease family protein [Calothrix sp. UHCC 0171]MEA5570581.1 thermonuclease family protein [Calothrix sp. UHCC 0171]
MNIDLIELILVLATVVGVTGGNQIIVKENGGKKTTVNLVCIQTQSWYNSIATQKLKQLLPDATPIVIRNIETDENGNKLGEVFLDNRSVNLQMVANGHAIVETNSLHHCLENKSQFLIAEANAKNKRLGLWQQSKNNSNSNLHNSYIKTLQGKLIYEELPSTRSVRAYRGEEFFLITNSPNVNRLLLRPSEKINRDRLKSWHNQSVEITAIYAEGTRPSSAKTPCPINANGECLPQGDGYQVLSIKRLSSPSK